jgi:Bacteriophage CII protein
LIVLIKHQLGTLSSQYEIEQERQERRSQALTVAMQILAKGQTPTYRKVGSALGVQASTIMRWFPEKDFIAEVKVFVGAVKSVSAAADGHPENVVDISSQLPKEL